MCEDRLSCYVRPLVTLGFAVLTGYLAVQGRLSADFLQGLCAAVILFWYGVGAGAALPQQAHQEKR